MTSQKTPKGDIMAICRLEFYRKQKNWKFCSQERIPKDSKKKTRTTNGKLNQTYNIETKKEEPPKPEPPEDEEQPDLDQAFVETDTGTATESDENAPPDQLLTDLKEGPDAETDQKPPSDPPNCPYSPKWSIQHWIERRRLHSPEKTSPEQDSNCPQPQTNPTEEQSDLNDNQDCYHQNYHLTPYEAAKYLITYLQTEVPNQCNPKIGTSVLYYNSNLHHGSNVPLRESHIDYGYDVPHRECMSDHRFEAPICEQHMLYHGSNVPLRESHIDHGYEAPLCEPNMPCRGAYVPCCDADMPHHGLNVPLAGTDVLETGTLSEWNAALPGEWEGHCAGEGVAWTPDWPEGAGGEDLVDGVDFEPPGDWLRDDVSMESVSSSEFVRGAALAPHSTQIDLLEVEEKPTQLSGAALTQAVGRHSRALRQLLAEARRRQTPTGSGSCSELCPPRPPPPFETAPLRGRGEQRGQGEGGRGRGRLKVIGIGMGRPYRL